MLCNAQLTTALRNSRAIDCGFCYRLPEYIIRTTDKSNSDYQKDTIKWARRLDREQMFDSFQFAGLEVGELEEGEREDTAYLSLRVTLLPIDKQTGLQSQPEPMVFSERSKFLRSAKGHWLYAAGEVRSEAAGFKGRVLNVEKDLENGNGHATESGVMPVHVPPTPSPASSDAARLGKIILCKEDGDGFRERV